jgi:PAS domain S-box-containing protein
MLDMLDNLLDYVPDGVFTVDAEWRIKFFNRAAEQITGIKRAEAVGRRCCDVFCASICENACALKQTLSTSRRVVNRVVYIIDARGQKIPISISTAALKDRWGGSIGGVESFRDLRLVEELHRELEQQDSFSDIIGRSAAMRQIFEILPQIAESDSAVLIEGASGTGKELFARAVHNLSRRRAKKFVAINCGALPDNLLESEPEQTGGTGPVSRRPVLSDSRHSDRIARPAGPPGGHPAADGPFHRTVQPAQRQRYCGGFRRGADAPYGARFSRQCPGTGEHYRARLRVVPRRGDRTETPAPPALRGGALGEALRLGKAMTLESMEKLVISDALRRNEGNRQKAAKELGINPSTLFRKLKALKLTSSAARPPTGAKLARGA